MSDPINKSVIDIAEGRSYESVEELITWELSPTQQSEMKVITMDMWKPFIKVAKNLMPNASIIHDNFHVIKYLNDAVNKVRKKEVKSVNDLKYTKYLFLKNKANWTERQTTKFNELDRINLKTSQAWRIKENFKGIFEQYDIERCKNYFEKWYINTLKSGLSPMIKVAETMLNHLQGIINSAIFGMSNSSAENLNGKIQIVKSIARGFKSIEGYRTAILFFTGKLNMSPL